MQRLNALIRLGSSGFSTIQKINNRPFLVQKSLFLFKDQMRNCSDSVIFDIESVEDFTDKVISSSVPVIVDFHAEWCGPCKALGPRLEEKVLGRNGEVLLARINVDYAGELATDYGISAVPTIIAFKGGEKIGGFTGVLDDEQLDDFIDNVAN
ncbi:unnamed protein product [Caenorhabditis auriculariae]|uniref:Thioredoxin domain-containing protein n=1 Tax=Caenorhabditis auriculariae TaxID=2777116 RepID=A0A8S1HBZ3_9PELO|nr:unnamed protein product [Caenorhabditis auriculariae]